MGIPVTSSISGPSSDFNNYQSSLCSIAAYAKAANQMELYNQAKDAHDKMAREYNNRNAEKKRGFWESIARSISFDTHVTLSAPYLEDDPSFIQMYKIASMLPNYQVLALLRAAVNQHNIAYGK